MKSQGANPLPTQQPDRPVMNPPFTVVNAMFICGNNLPTLFQGDSQAEWISGDVFDDEFMSCINKTVK